MLLCCEQLLRSFQLYLAKYQIMADNGLVHDAGVPRCIKILTALILPCKCQSKYLPTGIGK